jgi:hypothetical protein
MNLVFPELIGGLGNQLFIAAAGYTVGKYHGSKVCFAKATQNSHSTKDYRETVLKYLGDPVEFSYDLVSYNQPLFWHPDFSEWTPSNINTNLIFMKGYYQYYPVFDPIKEDLQERVLKGLEPYIISLNNKFKTVDFKKTAFLHIRRGDYLEKPDIHYNIPKEYYHTAYKTLCDKYSTPSTLLLFTDDVKWLSEQKDLYSLPGATIVNLEDEVESLALMTLCEGGAICANSTFSWWGAFLSKNHKAVFVPSLWCRGSNNNLFPSEWNII